MFYPFLCVLHVDDNKFYLEILELVIKRNNYNIIWNKVSNPLKAIALIKNGYYDYIISDYVMPEMNGLQFYQQTIKLGFTGKFVFLTAIELPGKINDQITSHLVRISKAQSIKAVQEELFRFFNLDQSKISLPLTEDA